MGKLRILSGREVCRILEQHGFVHGRTRGSHVTLRKLQNGDSIGVVVPLHREVRIGTLLSIIRQSQLDRGLFEEPE